MTSTKEPARFIDSAHELAETMRPPPMTSTKELIARLIKIADASRRDDGTDIPLGSELRAAADRLEALTAPVEGMETPRHIAEMRAEFEARKVNGDHRISALWGEINRLSSALATKEQERARSDDTVQELGLRLREEQARSERLVGALREIEDANEDVCRGRTQANYDAMIAAGQADALLRLDRARHEARAALSQEK